MRVWGLAFAGATALAATASVASERPERFERSLQMLAPEERLEQLCDYTAMTRIRSEKKEFKPDRAVANAMVEPVVTGDTLNVTGGAFRSHKKWYTLTYRCTSTADRSKIVTFSYTIGEEIPEAKWASFGLWQ